MTDKLEKADCPACLEKVGWEQVLWSLEDEELLQLDAACHRTFDAWIESARLEQDLWFKFASWAVRGESCPPELLARYLRSVGQTVKLGGEKKAAMEAIGKRVADLKLKAKAAKEAPSSTNRDEPK